MKKKQLLKELNNVTGLRENRTRVTNLVIDNISCLPNLIDIVFDIDTKIAIKATWIIEFIAKTDINLVVPYVDLFSKKIHTVYEGSAVRGLSKIVQLLLEENNKTSFLSTKQKERFVEVGFDWMISKHRVAIKAYTMRSLFLLGKKSDWIHKELSIIIKENMHHESAAFKSRGRITLEQIRKWN